MHLEKQLDDVSNEALLQSDFASVEHSPQTPQKLSTSQKISVFSCCIFWKGTVSKCHQEEGIEKSVNFYEAIFAKICLTASDL